MKTIDIDKIFINWRHNMGMLSITDNKDEFALLVLAESGFFHFLLIKQKGGARLIFRF